MKSTYFGVCEGRGESKCIPTTKGLGGDGRRGGIKSYPLCKYRKE